MPPVLWPLTRTPSGWNRDFHAGAVEALVADPVLGPA
jgi:hypothetical protein